MNAPHVPRHAAPAGSSSCSCGNDAEQIVRLGDDPALHRLCQPCVEDHDLATTVDHVVWISAA